MKCLSGIKKIALVYSSIKRFYKELFLKKRERVDTLRDGGNMNNQVLIVDDNFEDAQNIKSILEKNSYSSKSVANGAQAFDSLKKNNFSLVLIDIQMPTLSGYELLRLLKELTPKKVPMVYVSILPKEEVDMTGADGFIQKPIAEKRLLKAINQFMN